ncbi:hypothetical protein SH661x_000364 [Planctomicrobium sp. SH661]|uniref:hypothetical protein n=1 Tax=Planctomicrobium sp. SH661 TaxID=3448124 RepID=UPI003F5B1B74
MPAPGLLDIPESLRRQLLAFRKRLWTLKLTEAIAGSAAIVLVAYLLTYSIDRFIDPPKVVRWLIWGVALIALALVPLAWHRWVWRQRQLEQLARLLSRKHPSVGDQLLGIIELSHNPSEQARSPALVQAAIEQVSEVAAKRDFRDAVPHPRHRQRLWTVSTLAAMSLLLLGLTTAAAQNAWQRFLAPWGDTPRYTFATIESLPTQMVVAHGEPFTVELKLRPEARWKPAQAEVRLPGQTALASSQESGGYRFELPGQIAATSLHVRVGDFAQDVLIEPKTRPELAGLGADVRLPDYLERSEPVVKDIRGGSLSVVKGSAATVTATITRDIAAASVNDQDRTPQGATFSTEPLKVEEEQELTLNWRDAFGLSAQQPYPLAIHGVEDEAPSLICENLPRQQILLDSEVLTFQIRARDDFGVKRVGMVWQGLDENLREPAQGERMLGAGGSDKELLELNGTFSAKQLGIEPQPIGMRIFVEDYLPGRERVYSPQCVFHVLNAEQHAIWVTAQLSRWHRMALEVRDRELQLHEVNQELRALSPEELDNPATRQWIEAQAAAERMNGRRLTSLVSSGEEILKQAMRNPEIGVGHLEKWAEMMQILKDISGNRMPSVADLLKQAATSPQLAQNSANPRPTAGENKANVAGAGGAKSEAKPVPPVPAVTDVESTMNTPKPDEPKPPGESKPKSPRLTLPTTMLAGNGSGKKDPPPASKSVDEAVREQKDLLAEFEKIADELNTVLANLEGSTLVKRLKASARRQHQVAQKLGTTIPASFGVPIRKTDVPAATFKDLSEVEASSSADASDIMDDMAAYFERSRFQRFKVVLDDMRKQDVTAGLRNLSDDLRKENGLSISQAEFWSDTFDRWAEDLVEVTKCGACPGCKSKGSLPPSIVLEVLQILEGEVKLREETRVAEQAKGATTPADHSKESKRLSDSQSALRERIDNVMVRIRELPDAESDFGKELALLVKVSEVMVDATGILARPETGSPAIAAETEAIELLLQSKRFNPNGGGGGGSTPGGGGTGTTHDSALALVGTGINEKERREDHGPVQAVGTAGSTLPEEFRAGLDEYFNRLDRRNP